MVIGEGSSAFFPLRVFLVSWRPLVPDAVSSSRVTPGALLKLPMPPIAVSLCCHRFQRAPAPACFVLHFLHSDGFTQVQISCVLFCPFKGTCVKNSLGQRVLDAERAEPGHPEAQPRGSVLSGRASLVGVTQEPFQTTWPLTPSALRQNQPLGCCCCSLERGSGTSAQVPLQLVSFQLCFPQLSRPCWW